MNETVLERAGRELSLKRLAVLGLVAFGVSLLLMLAQAMYLLNHSHKVAGSSIEALTHDDLPEAIALIGDANRDASDAMAMFDDPVLGFVTKAIPLIDHERESLVVASTAAISATDGARDFLTGLNNLVGGKDLGATLYSDGAVRVDLVGRIVPLVDGLLARIDGSIATLRDTEPSAVSLIDGRIHGARLELARQRDGLERLRNMAAAIPGLLAEGTTRTYLLAFQSPSEARGGGGLVGVDGLLDVADGAIELRDIEPVRDLLPALKAPVDAPRWYEDTYGALGGTKDPRLANLSPTFPVSAQVLADIYLRRTGIEVDGVIAMDPLVLGNLTRATGPLKARGWSIEITPRNARRILLEDVYQHFHGKEGLQNGYFKNLVDVVMNRISSGDVDEFKLVQALSKSVAHQRLKIYSTDDETQGFLAKAGVTGDPGAYGPDVQMVFNNNFSANKIDFYLRRKVETHIEIVDTDEARVETTVTLLNDVPDDAEVNVLVRPGINRDLPVGTNQMTLHLLIPASAGDPALIRDGEEIDGFVGLEASHRMIWDVVRMDPGEEASLTFRYSFALAHEIEMTFIPQSTVRPDRYEVTMQAADGLCLKGRGGTERSEIRTRGLMVAPRTLSYKILEVAC